MTEYITGMFALNIHHLQNKDEPSGDWHGFIWDAITELPNTDVTYAGKNHAINTFDIWGDFGIFDDTDTFLKKKIILKTKKIFIANYYRAILDLLYFSLSKYEDVLNLNCATDDYFDTEEQKQLIIEKINFANTHISPKAVLNLKKWIDRELQYEFTRKAHRG